MQAADILRECESWEDFQRQLSMFTEKEKGDAFELLAKFVLQIHPVYATKLEKVWSVTKNEVPFTVCEHLGIPLKDYGIDIVVQTFTGDYWAVQAKYRSERDSSLTHEELATFISLTFGVSTRFAFGLVCTTTNRVTALLEGKERIGFRKADFWAGLNDEIFAQIRARLAKQPTTLVPTPPRSPSLVTNAKCLTEGVDIPEIDCVMFVDPKSSTVDIVQAAGRAMRNTEGKIKSYIVLPFVVRDGSTLDEAAASAGFDIIITILRALASQDERIAAELRAISRGVRSARAGIINFDLSAVVPTHVEAEKFIESIELKCWGKLKSIAYMPYEEASALVQKLGIGTQKQFRAWNRGARPDLPKWPRDLPGSPDCSYAQRGWISWGGFFKSGYVWGKYRKWMPFNEAREFARRLGLKSPNEWEAYRVGRLPGKSKMPPKMPSRPDLSYPDEWIGWHDFLGYSKKLDRDWWPFQQAREWAHKLELWRFRPQGGGQLSWKAYCAGRIPSLPPRPKNNIPTAPDEIYADSGWKGFHDWVGSPQTKQNALAKI